MDTTWISTLKDYWWLAALLFLLLARLWQTAIKTNKRLEELDKVAKHDGSITGLESKMEKIEKTTDEIMQKLERNKKDNQIINESLFAILQAMETNDCKNIPRARDMLQNHLIER